MKTRKQKRVTHEDVQNALKQFVRKGGMISKLPEQRDQRAEFIGSEKYDTYESLSSLASIAS